MARPTKLGLDYFPHDTHTDDDTSLQLLEAEFGLEAYAVYFKLLESIYAQGYAKQWGADDCLLFAKKIGNISVSKLSEIIKGCIRRSLFDEGVYNLSQILTSKAIQQRWLEAKRKEVSAIDPKVCLIEQTAKGVSSPQKNAENPEKGVFAAKTPVISAKTPVIAETIPQSKGKERKGNIIINNSARESESEFAEAGGQAPEWVRSAAAQHPALNLEQLQPPPPTATAEQVEREKIAITLKAGSIWRGDMMRKHNITEAELLKAIDNFELHCKTTLKSHRDLADTYGHFDAWLRIQLQQAHQPTKSRNHAPTTATPRPSPQDNERRQQERWDNLLRIHEENTRNAGR